MDGGKRKAPGADGGDGADAGGDAAKRARTEVVVHAGSKPGEGAIVASGPVRTSSLTAPTMKLTGHAAAVLTMKFDPSGAHIASGGKDKNVFLWNTLGDCENYAVLRGHKNAVTEVAWAASGEGVWSASADKTLGFWDATTGVRARKFGGHRGVVNGVAAVRRGSMALAASAGDDGAVKLWDARTRGCVQEFEAGWPQTCVAFDDAGDGVFSGGIDNDVKLWDMRKNAATMTLDGHTDTVTGVSLSPDGTHLLSYGMDGTLRRWDVRPFVRGSRCTMSYVGASSGGFEKMLLRCAWAPNGARIAAGSGDRNSMVWETASGKLLYRLPGHQGSCNEVVFHPTEPIVGSCGSDGIMFLGEISLV